MKWTEWASRHILRVKPPAVTQKQSPVGAALVEPGWDKWGTGEDWANPTYGEYYARSANIYSAIKLRADAIVRPPLRIVTLDRDGNKTDVEYEHPLAQLLRKVNPWWTRGDLWRATETYLGLWGSAYWLLKRSSPSSMPTEIWPARPDKIRLIADRTKYIAGFEYFDGGLRVPLLPSEVIWFRYFNPLHELAGFSPVAPVRLSADMGNDALKHNRNQFKNGLLFGQVAIETENTPTDEEINEFYKRLKKRFASPDNSFQPLVLSMGMKAQNLGFSPRDMEHLNTMRWSLEDVSRVYNVPKMLLQDLTNATYSNFDAAEKMFWRNTIVPECLFLQEEINEMLAPMFGANIECLFDFSQIEALQENLNEVYTRQRADVNQGILTVNEVRAERGLEAVPWGDSWWAPLTLLPISSGSSSYDMAADTGKALIPPLRISDISSDGWKRWTPPMLTDVVIDRVVAAHVKRLGRFENRFKQAQRDLFDKQLRSVIKKLPEQEAKGVVQKQVGAGLFDPDEWFDLYVKTGRPLAMAALMNSAEEQISTFGLGIAFDVTAPLVQKWLDERVKFWASRVNDETGRLLMQELQDANMAGESIKQIQERIEKVFRFNNVVRSEMIARTEMQASTNNGALDAYRQSGVVEQKMWLATLDERTRETHLEAHRQIVPVESPFEVGGEFVMAPGEGSAENVINCRCTIAPVIGQRSMNINSNTKNNEIARIA